MKFILLTLVFILSLQAEKILLINSNSNVEKYREVVKSFGEDFKQEFKTIDISNMRQDEIKEYLYDEYPDIVYAVGNKAYQYAHKYLPEKKIFFSSIVNWERLPLQGERFGISNELHTGIQLTLITSYFKEIKTISVIYSTYTADLAQGFKENSEQMGINIVAHKIEDTESTDFDSLIKSSDAHIIIPDPVLLSNEEAIQQLFSASRKYKKPIFAYDDLFIPYGAVLISAVDNPTIGRQMALILKEHLSNKVTAKIHSPIGTHIIFNKKEAAHLGVDFDKHILSITTKTIE